MGYRGLTGCGSKDNETSPVVFDEFPHGWVGEP